MHYIYVLRIYHSKLFIINRLLIVLYYRMDMVNFILNIHYLFHLIHCIYYFHTFISIHIYYLLIHKTYIIINSNIILYHCYKHLFNKIQHIIYYHNYYMCMFPRIYILLYIMLNLLKHNK